MQGRKPTTKRTVYPLEITDLVPMLAAARKKTGIKSQAQLMRLAIERGLPVLIAQLGGNVQRAA